MVVGRILYTNSHRQIFHTFGDVIWNEHYLNAAIKINVELKYGTTVFVFRSSSWSSVLDANRATKICLNIPVSCAFPTASKNDSSHSAPLLKKN